MSGKAGQGQPAPKALLLNPAPLRSAGFNNPLSGTVLLR